MEMMAVILEPFGFPFMQKALLLAVAVAVPMALLSCYLVLKGWSLMGDAIAHAVLPGVVIAYWVGLPLIIGAFMAGVLCAVAAGFLQENSRVKKDTILGIVFSGMFGLGLVLYIAAEPEVHLDHILFGNVLGVTWGDVAVAGGISLGAGLCLLVKRHDLLAQAFDPQHARAIGLPVGWLHYGLLALISLTVVTALSATGLILAIAFLIAPGAIAFLITRRFGAMLAAAALIGGGSAFLGVYLSFFLDSAPAPTIVVVMTVLFIAAFLATLRRPARPAGAFPKAEAHQIKTSPADAASHL